MGDILLLLGRLAWADYNVLGKRASAGQDSASVTYYQTLAGAAGPRGCHRRRRSA
jgi:drug/metabolite transporter (DMT)-like permease